MKKRIPYIDALRGFCILLIVALHCKLVIISNDIDLMLINMELPMFFFLSGLFYKRYSSFKEFLIRKVNNLIVPYLFFSHIPFCLFAYFFNGRYDDPLFYLFASVKPANTPLWFVRSLFFTYIFFYFIDKHTLKRPLWVKCAVIIILVLITCLTNSFYQKYSIVYPWLGECLFFIKDLFTSIMAMPFFVVAHYIKKKGWLDLNVDWKYSIFIAAFLLIIGYICKQNGFGYFYANYGDHVILAYLSGFSSIFGFGLLFSKFKYTRLLQYFGKYSMIVLGCHLVAIIVLQENFWPVPLILFIEVSLIMLPCIWFFKTYFPKFTAQKDFIKI